MYLTSKNKPIRSETEDVRPIKLTEAETAKMEQARLDHLRQEYAKLFPEKPNRSEKRKR